MYFVQNKIRKKVLRIEKVAKTLLFCSALISILITIFIILSILFESINFFKQVSIWDFLFGTVWDIQSSSNTPGAANDNSFGVIPIFAGTLFITFIAIVVAAPIAIFSAIYLSEYATSSKRKILKPLLEILSGIPSVVYGYFSVITVAPLIKNIGESFGLEVASESALTAGIVIGIMIIPFILSLSEDILHSLPNNLRDGSLALGATKAETITKIVIPSTLPAIISTILLAISRAIGETMIVVMAAGLTSNLTFNPLESVTTVTVQIVTLLVGDQEFNSAKTLSAFALSLLLFVITLFINLIALVLIKKYKQKYQIS